MHKALDVAAYLVKLSDEIGEPLSNMKLQKLLYYVYSWYGVEKNEKLFSDDIFAWKYGPVVLSVYEVCNKYGADVVREVAGGDSSVIENDDFVCTLVEDVFKIYGNKTAIELMNLTHSESPWRDTFNPSYQNTPISFDLITKYYSAKKAASGI